MFSYERGLTRIKESGVDGIMIGRASIGNPWIFDQIKHYMSTGEHLPLPSMAERVATVKKQKEINA